jgi:hypothetical protein
MDRPGYSDARFHGARLRECGRLGADFGLVVCSCLFEVLAAFVAFLSDYLGVLCNLYSYGSPGVIIN